MNKGFRVFREYGDIKMDFEKSDRARGNPSYGVPYLSA